MSFSEFLLWHFLCISECFLLSFECFWHTSRRIKTSIDELKLQSTNIFNPFTSRASHFLKKKNSKVSRRLLASLASLFSSKFMPFPIVATRVPEIAQGTRRRPSDGLLRVKGLRLLKKIMLLLSGSGGATGGALAPPQKKKKNKFWPKRSTFFQ